MNEGAWIAVLATFLGIPLFFILMGAVILTVFERCGAWVNGGGLRKLGLSIILLLEASVKPLIRWRENQKNTINPDPAPALEALPMNLRYGLLALASVAFLTLFWGYARLPFPGRYVVTSTTPGGESNSNGDVSRLDTWTGEVCGVGTGETMNVLIPAGPGVPLKPLKP